MATLERHTRMIWVYCDYLSPTTGEVTHRAKHFVEHDHHGADSWRKKSRAWLKANGPRPELGLPLLWVHGWPGQAYNGQKEVFGPLMPV